MHAGHTVPTKTGPDVARPSLVSPNRPNRLQTEPSPTERSVPAVPNRAKNFLAMRRPIAANQATPRHTQRACRACPILSQRHASTPIRPHRLETFHALPNARRPWHALWDRTLPNPATGRTPPCRTAPNVNAPCAGRACPNVTPPNPTSRYQTSPALWDRATRFLTTRPDLAEARLATPCCTPRNHTCPAGPVHPGDISPQHDTPCLPDQSLP